MIYIPDLFSAYTKGQEEAIDQNWKDLTQYEAVEQARTANDMARIGLQAGMDDYGNNRAISTALGTQAMIGEDLLKRGYRGDAANAEMNSDLATSQYNAVLNNLPGLDTLNNATLSSRIGTGINTADGALAYSNVDRNLLPQSLAAYNNAKNAGLTVANQNSANAPTANAALINSNEQTRVLNDANTGLGLAQTQNALAILPETFALQRSSVAQAQGNIATTEQQKLQQQSAAIAANINQLYAQISASQAQVSQLAIAAQQQPELASQYNAQRLVVLANIARDQKAIADIEKQFGTSSQNIVQSLMGK